MSRRSRHPKILSFAEMEKLTTQRLLAYRESLYKVPEGPSHEETLYGGKDTSLHKQTPEWRAAMASLKAVLAKREHVE